ncbi:putative RNA binding protein with dsRBD fold (UPF0201 family) [Paenibacillus sp. 4624]|uniref:hypothetical protein n=1 Tax=Paenibacillus sp. 4624 TaxID=3156453 RepID=UPI003D1D3398
MKVKSVIPTVDHKKVAKVMRGVFEQYDMCKCLTDNPEYKAFKEAIDEAVKSLNEVESHLISERYLIDFYRTDLRVYTVYMEPPISKDTYTKVRKRAFHKMFLSLRDQGIIV